MQIVQHLSKRKTDTVWLVQFHVQIQFYIIGFYKSKIAKSVVTLLPAKYNNMWTDLSTLESTLDYVIKFFSGSHGNPMGLLVWLSLVLLLFFYKSAV